MHRIRNNPHVRIARCDARGEPKGEGVADRLPVELAYVEIEPVAA